MISTFESIRLRKFKRFEDQSVPLVAKGVSFIAGGNNSGKSTILHGLAVWEFCRSMIEGEKGFGAFLPGSRHQGLGLGDDEFSPISVPSLRHLWLNLAPQKTPVDEDGYTLRICCTWTVDGAQKDLEFGLALANDRLFIKTTDSSLSIVDQIPRVAYLPPFAAITDHEARIPRAIRRRRIGEGLAGSVLRNTLLDLYQKNLEKRAEFRDGKAKIRDADLKSLRQSDPWELLQQTLRTTFSSELAVAPFMEEYHSHIKIEVVKGQVNGYKLKRHAGYRNRDLMVEGGGFLQWLSVYALATDPEVDVLLLDEPDAHLHCLLQQELTQRLIDLAEKTGKQVLIATHSTEILRQSPPEQILDVSTRRAPRYLKGEHQKVGLLAGLGADYAPRIDAMKRTKRVMFVEGDFDFKVLRVFSNRLGLQWPETLVEWPHKSDHKGRKHVFLALNEEIDGLVAISLRDRDDEPVNSVGDLLRDKFLEGCPPGFHAKKWRRRNVESYLLWPEAMAGATGNTIGDVEATLREAYGVAVGDTFPDEQAPPALLQIDGKDVLKRLGAAPLDVAERIPIDRIAADIRTLLTELIGLVS